MAIVLQRISGHLPSVGRGNEALQLFPSRRQVGVKIGGE